MRPDSPVGLAMMHFSLYNLDMQFSLCQLEVNNCNATTVVRPRFTYAQCPAWWEVVSASDQLLL